jgi:Ca-activated chloride channel homolog
MDMKGMLLLVIGWLVMTLSVSATGLIVVHDEGFWRRPPPRVVPPEGVLPPSRPFTPPRPPVWAPLETAFTKADIVVKEQLATTAIEQEFYNPNPRQLEGTFLFPIPKGAQINKFTMEINGKPVEAELLAADKAKGIYEDIVRRLKDPALLEYAGRDLFKVRIFPIEANSRKRITVSYTQLLKSDSGLVSLILPLNTEKFSAKPLKSVSVKIDLETKRPLKAVYSPSHKVEVRRHGGNKATVGYEATDVKPDADLQVFFAQEQDDVGLNLLTYKTAGEDGYFVLLASPGAEAKGTKVIPKDVALVLDTSGSMAGGKLEQARKALAFCVENLNDADRFQILRFSTEVEPLFDKLVEASRERRAKAQTFVKELKPIGGTAIDDALKKALGLRPEKGDRPYFVIFLTDGRPTVGNTAEDAIVNATSASKGNVRVFCFGIGTDVNTHLLDKIAEETRAVTQYVLPEEDLEVKLSSFFSKIKEPVLANLKVSFPDSVRVSQLYPSALPDLFKGEQLVLVGRYSGKGDGSIGIEGIVNGETGKLAQDVTFADEAHDHDFIPRLWATRRVGYLLDEIRLRGESKEVKDEVVELARKYSIVTPYTAYLIVEDEVRRGVAQNARTLRFENQAAQRDAGVTFELFMKDKGGERAVASARSYSRLKSADAASEAITAGSVDAFRAAPASRSSGPAIPGEGGIPSRVARAESDAREYSERSRFVGGKTFFQHEGRWTDSEIQKQAEVKKVGILFGSPEYFELLNKHPQAAAWLSVGSNVQFVLDGTIYEVHD